MSNLQSGASEAQLIDLFQNFKMPIMGAGGGFAPIGTINFFDASIAPQGWLACDGTVYNISDYPEYAAHIASHHGASNFYGGNGTTTFAVPNLQGEFLRGSGTNSHANQGSGANVGVHQDATKVIAKAANVSGLNLEEEDIGYDYRQVPGTSSGYYTNGTSSTNRSYMTTRPTNTSFLIIVKATVSGNPEGHVYSTTEHIYGHDEDTGEIVYEKTIKRSGLSTKNVVLDSTLNRTNCILWGVDGGAKIDSGNYISLGYSGGCNIVVGASDISLNSSDKYTFSACNITIRYKKVSS